MRLIVLDKVIQLALYQHLNIENHLAKSYLGTLNDYVKCKK